MGAENTDSRTRLPWFRGPGTWRNGTLVGHGMDILFVCRDAGEAEWLALAMRLRWGDLRATVVPRGDLAMQELRHGRIALAVIGEDLPPDEMWTAIGDIRRASDVPILALIRGAKELDVLTAIDLGADACIPTPCSPLMAVARAGAILRRAGLTGRHSDDTPLHCGELTIDPAKHYAQLGSRPLHLSRTEFRLLKMFVANCQTTLTMPHIEREIWGVESKNRNRLKKYVQRLRHKLGDDARNPTWLKTIHGEGYRFCESSSGSD